MSNKYILYKKLNTRRIEFVYMISMIILINIMNLLLFGFDIYEFIPFNIFFDLSIYNLFPRKCTECFKIMSFDFNQGVWHCDKCLNAIYTGVEGDRSI